MAQLPGTRKPFRSPSRRRAQKIANEFEDVARRKRTAQQVQRVFREIYEEVTSARLSWDQIDLEAREIRLQTNKTGRHQKIPIPPPLMKHIKVLRKGEAKVGFHSLRHTTTSLLKNAGVSPAIAEEFVGRDSAEMNRVHTHIELDAMKKAAGLLPDVTAGL